MARNLVPRIPLLLSLSTMTDAELHTLVGAISVAAPTSTLVAGNPAMAASVVSLAADDAALTKADKAVSDDHAKLHADIALLALARTSLVGEVRNFANLAVTGAKLPADLHGAGLTARDNSISRLPPAVPEGVDTKIPVKGHGKAVVSVHETGPTRHQYIAEQSPDGITWAPLGLGRGKTRTLTGATGTKIWVRFAMVRGSQQSDWCTPVLVTIP